MHMEWDYGEEYYAPHPVNTSKFAAIIKDGEDTEWITVIGIIGNEVCS